MHKQNSIFIKRKVSLYHTHGRQDFTNGGICFMKELAIALMKRITYFVKPKVALMKRALLVGAGKVLLHQN
jgi:hypothetical protein